MALSLLELRHIIESGFLPLHCKCTSSVSGELSIEVVDTSTGANVVVEAIPLATLSTSRAIAELIGQVRVQLGSPARRHSRPRATF